MQNWKKGEHTHLHAYKYTQKRLYNTKNLKKKRKFFLYYCYAACFIINIYYYYYFN